MLDRNKIYIFDDMVPEPHQNYLSKIFRSSDIQFQLPNTEVSSGVTNFDNFDPKFKEMLYDKPQLSCGFAEPGRLVNDSFYYLTPLYNYIQKYFNYSFNYKLERCKANLKTQVSSKYLDKFNPPHIDSPNNDCWSVLYYIDDSDGDTVIFKETTTEDPNKYPPTSLTIDQKISPKKGRIIFFPSNRLHSANCPIEHDYRLILNSVLYIFPVD